MCTQIPTLHFLSVQNGLCILGSCNILVSVCSWNLPLVQGDYDYNYFLECPRCGETLTSMWFCEDDGNADAHGLVSCSYCVSWLARASKLPRNNWRKISSKKDYCKHPRSSWETSLTRTKALLQRLSEAAAKAAAERPKKRKPKNRKRARALQSEKPAAPAVVSPPSTSTVATQTKCGKKDGDGKKIIHAFRILMAINAGKHGIDWDVVKRLLADIGPADVEKQLSSI